MCKCDFMGTYLFCTIFMGMKCPHKAEGPIVQILWRLAEVGVLHRECQKVDLSTFACGDLDLVSSSRSAHIRIVPNSKISP